MGGMTNSRPLAASVRIGSLVMPTDSSFKVTSCYFDFLSPPCNSIAAGIYPARRSALRRICENRWRPEVGHLTYTQVLTVPVFTICLVPGKREYWRQHSAFRESETDTASAAVTDDASLNVGVFSKYTPHAIMLGR
jgi:hypothetical protein